MVSAFMAVASLAGLGLAGFLCLKAIRKRVPPLLFNNSAASVSAAQLRAAPNLRLHGRQRHPQLSQPRGLTHLTGLNKAEAEDLLDWLEATGRTATQVSYQAGAGFTVDF
jgi:hypothetical protein